MKTQYGYEMRTRTVAVTLLLQRNGSFCNNMIELFKNPTYNVMVQLRRFRTTICSDVTIWFVGLLIPICRWGCWGDDDDDDAGEDGLSWVSTTTGEYLSSL
jgi:hypothetical protein